MAGITPHPRPIRSVALVTECSASDIADPVSVLGALGATGSRRILLESAGAPPGEDRAPTLQRSILVARPLLHCEARGGVVQWRVLVEEGQPLLARLSKQLPTATDIRLSEGRLSARYPSEPATGVLGDEERLRQPSVLDAVRATAGLLEDCQPTPLPPGVFGAFSYELADHFESLPPRAPDPLDEPDLSFVLAGDVVVWDHALDQLSVLTRRLPWEPLAVGKKRHQELLTIVREAQARPSGASQPAALEWESDLDEAAFSAVVRDFLQAIAEGQIFQGVPARQLRTRSSVSSLKIYAQLRALNPSPYMFHADLGDGVLLGASPETCVRVDAGEVEVRPIAGTAPRGRLADEALDPDLDTRLALSLRLDPKELAEHCMLVDLARNDVARVSEPGTTRLVQLLEVERYAHVQHLVSRVRGRLRAGLDALHAYRAAANMGTLTGAPKPRAMTLIRRAEPTARGFYGGGLGYFLQDGQFDTCIVIRSARVRRGEIFTRVGAGIVAASLPAREFLETQHKARSVCQAVAAAAGEPS